MTIQTHYDAKSATFTLRVGERLDFKCQREFRLAYEEANVQPRQVVVDLSATRFIDSSGLGMLLLLREFFGADQSNIRLSGVSDEVGSLLDVANFGKLFKIH